MACIFCKIASGEIPAKKLFEDDKLVAFYDIQPQSPVHFLIIPKHHFASLNDLSADHVHLAGHILVTASNLARETGIDQSGYRVVFNTREDGGQSVDHLHAHILGKRKFLWPPG
ncbi:MAG: histidine triad nucleotide-binding protein [Bacteroidetes bacterium]|nr:histidine triad nucleotide-binding protein [Bacteroidota bacterium]